MLCCQYSQSIIGYQSESRYVLDIRVYGQIRFEYGYVWTWKFLSPGRKSCGFKHIRIRVEGA